MSYHVHILMHININLYVDFIPNGVSKAVVPVDFLPILMIFHLHIFQRSLFYLQIF
jgi:hypothetical protein